MTHKQTCVLTPSKQSVAKKKKQEEKIYKNIKIKFKKKTKLGALTVGAVLLF